MRRRHLHLDEATQRALTSLAARTGRSEAFHVREAVRRYLQSETDRADPLERLIGLVSDAGGPKDVAKHHDNYLYGRRRNTSEDLSKRTRGLSLGFSGDLTCSGDCRFRVLGFALEPQDSA
jgi:hypothetical protein